MELIITPHYFLTIQKESRKTLGYNTGPQNFKSSCQNQLFLANILYWNLLPEMRPEAVTEYLPKTGVRAALGDRCRVSELRLISVYDTT